MGDRRVGCFGDAEVFSLHASKLINGFEGGYITTSNQELAQRLRLRRGFGLSGPDQVVENDAMNAKLNEIHAAMALASLDDLDDQVIRNRQTYRKYQSLLEKLPGIRLLEFDETEETSFKNIVVELREDWPLSRQLTLDALVAENVLARAYYSPPLHSKPMKYPYVAARLPRTTALSEKFMLLPCGDMVDLSDIDGVVSVLSYLATNADKVIERVGRN